MSDRQDRNSRKRHSTLTGKERSVRQVRAAPAAGPCNGPRQTDTQCLAGQGPSLSNLHSWRDRDPSKPVAALLAFSMVLKVLLQLHVTQGATAVSLNALGGLHGHTSSSACPSPGPPALHTLPFSWVLVPQVIFQVLEPREPCSPWGPCPWSFKCDHLKWG